MKCDKCGVEYDLSTADDDKKHEPWACRDELAIQLSQTKMRADAACEAIETLARVTDSLNAVKARHSITTEKDALARVAALEAQLAEAERERDEALKSVAEIFASEGIETTEASLVGRIRFMLEYLIGYERSRKALYRQAVEAEEQRDALRAELAECRAELRREHEANAHDPVRQKLKAAEARAERYETTLREMRSQCVRGAHSDDDRIIDTIDAALAETANKTESRGIPRTNDEGERRGNIHPARLDPDGTAIGKTILTGRVRSSSSGEGTNWAEPGSAHIDLETGKRTALTPPPAGEGDEGQKTSEASVAPSRGGQDKATCSRPAEAPQEPGSPSGDDERNVHDGCPHDCEACTENIRAVFASASPPTPPATSTPDDDAEQWTRKHLDWVYENGADSVAEYQAIVGKLREAREAGRVEGWDEAVEACAKSAREYRRIDNTLLSSAAEYIAERIEKLKRPDRAKGGPK